MSTIYLTVKEYAERFQLAEGSVRRLCGSSAIPCLKVGRGWRIAVEEESAGNPQESISEIVEAIDEFVSGLAIGATRLRSRLKEIEGSEGD